MERLRVAGGPESVFSGIQGRLRSLGIEPRFVDWTSITMLFEIDLPERNDIATFFLAVVPAGPHESDIVVARKRKGLHRDFQAMQVGAGDPVEKSVLRKIAAEIG